MEDIVTSIVLATFTSGQRLESATVTWKVNPDGTGPTSSITQVWNELADSSAWSYDPHFQLDTASTLSYSMALVGAAPGGGNTPIENHALSFESTLIGGVEWDTTLGEIAEDGEPYGDYDARIYSKAEAEAANVGWHPPMAGPPAVVGWEKWKGLSTLNPVQATQSGGSYSTSQKVKDGYNENGEIDFFSTIVDFDVVDGSVVSAYTPPATGGQ